MSNFIDLMPEVCRKRLGRRRRMRQWIALYVASATVIAVAAIALRVVDRSRLGEVERLRERVQLDAGQRLEAEALKGKIDLFQTQIDRQERLTLPVSVSDLIAAIGEVMPESVSLSSLSVTPRLDKNARSRAQTGAAKGAANDAPAQQNRLLVEIKGVAPDDLQMATFVAGLEARPLFKAIAVDFARKTELRGKEAREFALTAEIDVSTRFVFGDDAKEAVGP